MILIFQLLKTLNECKKKFWEHSFHVQHLFYGFFILDHIQSLSQQKSHLGKLGCSQPCIKKVFKCDDNIEMTLGTKLDLET